jgi:Protein of unknown function (DUF3800)
MRQFALRPRWGCKMTAGKESLYITGLARRVHPLDGHGKWFAMLQAYIDESGIHHESQLCALAGYVGGVRRWSEFERRWGMVLDQDGIEEFHAKEFWARHNGKPVGDYEGWTENRLNGFLNDLLGAIRATDIYPSGAGIVVGEWNKLNHNERRYITGAQAGLGRAKFYTSGSPTKPYFVPFHHCVFNPTKYCKPQMKVHFVADQNKQLEGWAVRVFSDMKELTSWGSALGDLTFSDSKSARGLQAADLLAYRIYQFGRKKLLHPRLRPDAVLAAALSKQRSDHDLKLFDKRGLDLLLENFRASFPEKINDGEHRLAQRNEVGHENN